jgi:hypothetical protein
MMILLTQDSLFSPSRSRWFACLLVCRGSTRRCGFSQEDVQGLLETMKAVNAKMEAQELELQHYMLSMGLVPPEAPNVIDPEAPIVSAADA